MEDSEALLSSAIKTQSRQRFRSRLALGERVWAVSCAVRRRPARCSLEAACQVQSAASSSLT
eukprot:2393965-Rhodomonas_salina.1